MQTRSFVAAVLMGSIATFGISAANARAEGDLHNVNHIIIVMQENRSFDQLLRGAAVRARRPVPRRARAARTIIAAWTA